MPYFSWEFCWKMRFKQKLQISLYFIQKFKEIFRFFTFIHFISRLYKLHTPQGVHVTNTWSNLAFWYKEHPNKNMLYFGIETGTPKSKYMFCKILHSQLNQSSWKGQPFFKRIAATLQGTIWIVMKKCFQTKLYTFPKKELYLISDNNAFPAWSKHLEKGMYFSKNPKRMLQHFKGYCVL